MISLETRESDNERIMIIIWPAREDDPRLEQLDQFDNWLRHRTWWQMRCLEIVPAIVLSAVSLFW